MNKVADVVERHDDHHGAPQSIDGPEPVASRWQRRIHGRHYRGTGQKPRAGFAEEILNILSGMLRPCTSADIEQIFTVINDGAEAYRGVIPADCWHEPYMTMADLQRELDAGVRFWCADENGRIEAVMGIQDVLDVALIRHAYTRTSSQGKGVGGALLAHLRTTTDRRILIGTWTAASWAIRFYEGRGFEVVPPEEKERLLNRYWTVSERQIAESVVLAETE